MADDLAVGVGIDRLKFLEYEKGVAVDITTDGEDWNSPVFEVEKVGQIWSR